MTASTISSIGNYNFTSSGTKVLTLYNIQSEDIRKSAGVIDLPMPTFDSNGKIVMDLMGASREITVEGIITTADAGGLNRYAQDIVGLNGAATGYATLIDGAQGTNQYSYFSQAISNTILVCVTESSIKYEKGNPNSMAYSITMMEWGTLI
jgi:hypothetical protein